MRMLAHVAAILVCLPMAQAQTVNVDPTDANTGTLQNSLQFGHFDAVTIQVRSMIDGHLVVTNQKVNHPPGEGIISKRTASGNQYGLDFFTGNAVRMSITNRGLVGIGMSPTLLPNKALEVHGAGDVELGLQSNDPTGRLWTLQSSGVYATGPNVPLSGTFQIIDRNQNLARLVIDQNGKVAVNVLQINGGSDVAEPFPISQNHVTKGSVVVIDDVHPGQLKVSSRAYDTRVAGIVSGAGGVQPGLSLQQKGLNDGLDVALSGRVFALADASRASIKPGDLLTTSPMPGYCMKAVDRAKAQGAILGKAMGSLDRGKGMILILVSLQ